MSVIKSFQGVDLVSLYDFFILLRGCARTAPKYLNSLLTFQPPGECNSQLNIPKYNIRLGIVVA